MEAGRPISAGNSSKGESFQHPPQAGYGTSPIAHRGGIGGVMNDQIPKYVTRARACVLLGLPEAEITRISSASGLGQVERVGDEKETYFTYEELQRICQLAADQSETIH